MKHLAPPWSLYLEEALDGLDDLIGDLVSHASTSGETESAQTLALVHDAFVTWREEELAAGVERAWEETHG